jgi:catechol 2,3-dioxygenase-like lactoylglutathione lyase family enzyme
MKSIELMERAHGFMLGAREDPMAVKRIVANIATEHPGEAKGFYCDILGLQPAMDLGWIITFAAEAQAAAQLNVASEGGGGTKVPDLSIEVDDLDEIHRRVLAAGLPIDYGPKSEAWGVRRFFVRDPFGRLVNILSHEG